MAYQQPNKLTSWSFSRWSLYEECPKRAFFKFIKKLPEPSSPAMARGTELHSMCEKYLKVGGRLPAGIKPIAVQLKDFKKRGALAEADFTFKKDWSLTRWDDWNGAWCRIKADVTIPPIADADIPTVEVHDFKSGGKVETTGDVVVKEEYPIQLELYGIAGLIAYPTALVAKTSLVFIDHGKTVENEEVYHRKDLPKLKKKWELRTKKMLADTKFKEKPGNACRWCPYSKSKGGPCQF